ncbi:Uncharacterized protein Adt_41436 [Abeliophyllum distichum]|uniref:Transposase, Ptta/En/Spm, plant n=1 Tax=Abeliophyllum distichum TaxID=126358 RepID=A0ABD1PNU6_9LAMI
MVLTEIDLLHDDISSNFSLFVDLGNLDHITMQRVDIDAIQLDRPAKRASSSNVSGDDYNFINDKEEDNEDEDDNDEGDNGGEVEASDTETDCDSVIYDDDANRRDDGDEPPHQHANRLQVDCQTDFDTKEGTYLPTGENHKYLSRVVGTRVRQFVHPYFDRWANVPEEQKASATGFEFFDVNPRRYSKADYKLIVDGIEDTSARRYRQYKFDVNAYIRDKSTAVPYRGLTTDVWKKCIERSSSKKFKRDRQTQEWSSVIETFKVNHQRNGEWVNERAAQDYEKMVEEREEQTQQASSSSVAVNEHDVVLKFLGERRGHRRVVGRVLRGTSRSHSSTTRLRDQHSTS